MQSVKYETRLPSMVVKQYCDMHPERIKIAAYLSGFDTNTGRAYDIVLRDGWCTDCQGLHIINERTAFATLAALRAVMPCECADCKKALAVTE